MNKSHAKQQRTVVVTGVSLEFGYAAARGVGSGFFARRIPFRHLLLCTSAVTLTIPLAGCKRATDKKPLSPAAEKLLRC
jgi:hypothetical protein